MIAAQKPTFSPRTRLPHHQTSKQVRLPARAEGSRSAKGLSPNAAVLTRMTQYIRIGL